METTYKKLKEGVFFRGIRDTRFKNMSIAVHILTPLLKETASDNAFIPSLLLRALREYPDYTELNRRLCDLYGAMLSSHVDRCGNIQILSVSASCIADDYTLYGEKLSEEISKMLCSMVFNPLLDENGAFLEEGFQIERRQLLEQLDAEINDKRLYARRKCVSMLLRDEKLCDSKFGERDILEKVTGKSAADALFKLLKEARIEICAIGNCEPERVLDAFMPYVDKLERDFKDNFVFETAKPLPLLEKTEEMDVVQAKLVMGFQTGTNSLSNENHALRLAATIFGGSPNSKLFLHVREEKSLCYYCSVLFDSHLGTLMVDSGVDAEKADEARSEIMHQLSLMQNGEFTDDEIEIAKLYLTDSYRTVFDFISGLDTWYLYRTFFDEIPTPEEVSEIINNITREEIIEVSKKLSLCAVYYLSGGENDE